jgi:hypothetical protein
MSEEAQVAKIEYVPPVRTPDYVQGSFDTLAVVQLVTWAEAVAVEFTMPPEVEAIVDGFRSAIAEFTDIPTVAAEPRDAAEGGALV